METKVFVFPPPMLDEDIQLRAFQALKVDRNHLKLNLNQLSSLSKFESVGEISRENEDNSHLFHLDNYSYMFPSTIWLLRFIPSIQFAI